MTDKYWVKVIELLTGDSRFVYVGSDKKQALKVYNNNRRPNVEVEFYKNGELSFWYQE